ATTWWIVLGTVLVSSVLVLAGARAVGLLVLLLVAASLAVYRYLLAPDGGRRWLAVHEHGFVVLPAPSGRPVPRAVHWSEVTGADLPHHPVETFTLTLAPRAGVSPAAAPDPDVAPAPVLVPLTGLAPRGKLLAAVDRSLPGALDPAARQGREQQAHRTRYFAAGLGAVLLIPVLLLAAQPGGTDPDGKSDGTAQANPALAMTALPEDDSSWEPSYPPGWTPDVLPEVTSYPEGESSGGTTGPAGVPDSVYDYDAVCKGTQFAGAPARTGPAPHPVYVSTPGEAYFPAPVGWTSDDPTKIQLVACVTVTHRVVLGSCYYVGDKGRRFVQKRVRAVWHVTLRESSTAKVVARSGFITSNRACQETITIFGGTADTFQYPGPSAANMYTSVGLHVVR
ncbi:MAG TPA: hypothetical protein VGO89_07335, partial [Streptomyces sp.]|nr:hypothetical protein [Streptomyces sp.]